MHAETNYARALTGRSSLMIIAQVERRECKTKGRLSDSALLAASMIISGGDTAGCQRAILIMKFLEGLELSERSGAEHI